MLVVANDKKPKVGKPHTYKKLIKRRLKNKKTQLKRNEKYEMAKTILLNVKKQGNNHSSTAIVNIDHISSYASVAMWSFLKSRLEKHFPNISINSDNNNNNDIVQDQDLVKFFNQISIVDVKEEEVKKATDAYIFDKFETRIESTFLVLLYIMIDTERRKEIEKNAPSLYKYITKSPLNNKNIVGIDFNNNNHNNNNIFNKSKLNIASIGGACGNDLIGAILFIASFIENIQCINAISYDFSTSWNTSITLLDEIFENNNNNNTFVETIKNIKTLHENCKQTTIICQQKIGMTNNDDNDNDMNKKIKINMEYRRCDLKRNVSDKINEDLLNHVNNVDLFIFSYVVFETNACQFELLPEIIKRATSNSLFIFLDPHQKTLNAIIALLGRLEEEEKEKGDNNNIEELHGGEDGDEEESSSKISNNSLYEIIKCQSSSFYRFNGMIVCKK